MQSVKKVHKQPAIRFIPEEESTAELDKVRNHLEGFTKCNGWWCKNNVMKNRMTEFKMGNLEEFINWKIWLNHIIQNKPYKMPDSQFDMM
eukprot:259356-Ditylum_brightwellii.AAC.1